PHKLTAITHSQSFQVASHAAPPAATPALLNSKCTWPNASSVCRANRSTSLRFETSVLTPSTVPPAVFSSVSALVRLASSISARTTFMPSLTHRSAIPRPMPLAAPVITATLPLKSFIVPSRGEIGGNRLPTGRFPVAGGGWYALQRNPASHIHAHRRKGNVPSVPIRRVPT